jgi:thiol-disulfide isomerase/thioredoxin
MRFYRLAVLICLFAQVSAPITLTRTWLNQNRETRSMTQVIIRQEQSRILVHAWGACHPVDCDWGEVEAEPRNGIPLKIGEPASPALFAYSPAGTQAKERTQLQRQAPVGMQDQPAPDFVLRDLDNREVRLSELRGKVVLLDFWATWCEPCRAAFPMIELLHRSYKEKGLVVLGIDNEPPQKAREFLKQYGYLTPSLVDANSDAAMKYRVGSIPTTVLIDREGKVAFYEAGFSYEQLRVALRLVGIW